MFLLYFLEKMTCHEDCNTCGESLPDNSGCHGGCFHEMHVANTIMYNLLWAMILVCICV